MRPGLFAPFHRVGYTSVKGSERIPLQVQSAYPPQFAGSFDKRLSRIACSSLMLLALAAPLPAVDMLYVTTGNNTIVSYDTTGNVGSTIAASMATFASTNLNNPQGLAFDSTGNLYAANPGVISTISKFNSSGAYVSNITTNLNGPAGLAFDTSGNLYAANTYDSTISKFSSSGSFLASWSTGTALPMYIAFKPVTVPEPSTYALATIATGVMAYLARRRKARTA